MKVTMMSVITLLCVLFIFSKCNALAPFIPKDMEVLYDYNAVIRSGTDIPVKFASEFYLSAKLHIQANSEKLLLVQPANVTFKLYNGKIKAKYQEEFHDLPVNTDAITKPFQVILDSTGQAEGIVTENSDKVYVRNMHKALAALLQIKTDHINFAEIKHETFVTQEHSIYGKGRTVYTVVPSENKLVIKKMRAPVSTERMYQLLTTTSEGDVCEASYEEPLAHDSHQVYTFNKLNDTYILKHIKSSGGLYFYPFKAKSEAHYIHSSITLNFISVSPIKVPIKIQNEHYEKGLTYDIYEPTLQIQDSLFDSTIIPILNKLLDQITQYLQKNHMHTDVDIHKAHFTNSAIRILRTCKHKNLENLYNNIKSDDFSVGKERLKIFYKIMPFIGTHASVVLVKQIIHAKEVDDDEALEMIKSVATYARFPTEELLRDTEDMLSWGDEINKSIRKSAALAFGTLIHKVFKHEKALANRDHQDLRKESKVFHQDGTHTFSQGLDSTNTFLEQHPIYKQYMDTLVNKLKSSSDVESQVWYLQVIFNTKLSLAIPHLIPIVKGHELTNHDVREVAFWALSHMLLGNQDLIIELYWPFLTDDSLHTELRIIAYYIIIKSRLTLTGMLNMHYVMQSETNPELYNFHYTYLQQMSQSNDPCNQISQQNAAQILKFTRKPNQQALSRYYQTNFYDQKYGHGVELNGLYITAAHTRMFFLDVNVQAFNKKSNYYLFFFKIGGLEKQLSRSFEFNLKDSFGLLNYAELWKTISSVSDMKNFHIQISISNNYHTVQLYYFDKSNLHEFYGVWMKLFEDKFVWNKKMFDLNYEDQTELIFPTEIGMPASYEMFIPTMTHKHLGIETKADNGSINFLIDSKLVGLRSMYWGLHFYNPIIQAFQGIKRYHTYNTVLPVFMEISINKAEQSIAVLWKKHEDEEENMFGLRSYATNYVYIEDYVAKNILQASCVTCSNRVQVTRGDPFRSNHTILYDEGSTTGFALKGVIFDAEHHDSSDSLNTLIQSANHNKKLTALGNVLTLLRNFHIGDIFQPSPGTQGYLFVTYITATQVGVKFDVKEVISQQKNEFLPAIKFNSHMRYQIQNNDTIVKELDINFLLETNVGHTLKTVKVDTVLTNLGKKDLKFCINGNKTWEKSSISSYITMSTSKGDSDECNDIAVEILKKGEQLEKDLSPFHIFEVCDSYSHRLDPDYHSMRCLAEHTAIKKYTYEINTYQTSSNHENVAKDLFAFFLDKYHTNHNYYSSYEKKEGKQSIQIMFDFINENEANIDIITPEGTHGLIAVPVANLFWIDVRPDNTHFSTFFLWMNELGIVHTCLVRTDEIQHEFNEEKQVETFAAGDDWTMVVGIADVDPQQAVFLKKYGENMLALKIIYQNQTLEIHPEDEQAEQFKIIFNGREVSQVMDHYKEDWFSYVIRPLLKSIVVTIFHLELHLDYTAKELVVQIPRVSGIPFYGPCAKTN